MEQRELNATTRAETGKGSARRIRREGKIPAILYGRKIETFKLALKPEDLKKILTSGAGENTLIGLKIAGPGSEKAGNPVVMLKDLQVHPISQAYLHADFQAVVMDETVEVDVPIRLAGKPEGTKVGGILAQSLRELRIRCLPKDIPEFMEVDVSALLIGDSVHARDVAAAATCEILTDPNIPVASVTPPISEAKFEEMVAAPEGERAEIAQPERIGEKKEEAAAPEEQPKEAKEPKK